MALLLWMASFTYRNGCSNSLKTSLLISFVSSVFIMRKHFSSVIWILRFSARVYGCIIQLSFGYLLFFGSHERGIFPKCCSMPATGWSSQMTFWDLSGEGAWSGCRQFNQEAISNLISADHSQFGANQWSASYRCHSSILELDCVIFTSSDTSLHLTL